MSKSSVASQLYTTSRSGTLECPVKTGGLAVFYALQLQLAIALSADKNIEEITTD